MNFNAYTKKDLQHIAQFLQQCENDNITDLATVRGELFLYLYPPQEIKPAKNKANLPPEFICPECGAPMYPAKKERGELILVDGKMILVCGKCRYSEVIK